MPRQPPSVTEIVSSTHLLVQSDYTPQRNNVPHTVAQTMLMSPQTASRAAGPRAAEYP